MSMKSKVSIWMGLFENNEALKKYTNIEYTDDGAGMFQSYKAYGEIEDFNAILKGWMPIFIEDEFLYQSFDRRKKE